MSSDIEANSTVPIDQPVAKVADEGERLAGDVPYPGAGTGNGANSRVEMA
jgi:hypothetical protein